jgi:hypothetical protein
VPQNLKILKPESLLGATRALHRFVCWSGVGVAGKKIGQSNPASHVRCPDESTSKCYPPAFEIACSKANIKLVSSSLHSFLLVLQASTVIVILFSKHNTDRCRDVLHTHAHSLIWNHESSRLNYVVVVFSIGERIHWGEQKSKDFLRSSLLLYQVLQ